MNNASYSFLLIKYTLKGINEATGYIVNSIIDFASENVLSLCVTLVSGYVLYLCTKGITITTKTIK